MHAAVVPGGVVTGNSLGVARVLTGSHVVIEALLGILNSLVFEFQLRSKLATAHVSKGSLREVPVPAAALRDAHIANAVRQLLRSGSGSLSAKVEMLVARSYGLSKQEFAEILTAFPRLPNEERNNLLQFKYWK